MADPSSPNYYEQVARESDAAIKADDEKIADCVMGLTERRFKALRHLLEREFGRAVVSNARLHEFFDLLHEVAAEGAEAGKGVLIDRHHREAQKSAGSMLKAVMAGMELAKEPRAKDDPI
jgi:hypothetical protein